MEQESYPLKSCPHPRRLVQVNIGLWVSFQVEELVGLVALNF